MPAPPPASRTACASTTFVTPDTRSRPVRAPPSSKAGLTGGKGTPDTVQDHPRVFVTLTAPSFGAVHNRDKNSRGTRLTCKCGRRHTPDDPELGIPVDPRTYDYAGAVLWNAHAPALWARFTTYLRRRIAAQLGLTVTALGKVLRISFAKVAEYQKRGLIHYHAIIRFDGPEGGDQPPPVDATTEAPSRTGCSKRSCRLRPTTNSSDGTPAGSAGPGRNRRPSGPSPPSPRSMRSRTPWGRAGG